MGTHKSKMTHWEALLFEEPDFIGRVGIDKILDYVCEVSGVAKEGIISSTRLDEVVIPRSCFYFLACEYGFSNTEVGKHIGKSQSAVSQLGREAKERYNWPYSEYKEIIDAVRKKLYR